MLLLEQLVRRNDKEMEEEEFWQNELLIEQESEQQLHVKLAELQSGVRHCEAKLEQYLARIEVGVASALSGFSSSVSVRHQKLVPRCREWRQVWSKSSCSRRLSSTRRSTRRRYKRWQRLTTFVCTRQTTEGTLLNTKYGMFQLASVLIPVSSLAVAAQTPHCFRVGASLVAC